MNDLSAFGSRVQKRRKELNLTQEDLAFKMGYKTKSSINKIEKGLADIPQGKIVQLADVLSTTPAYLMGWEGESHKYSDTDQIIAELYNSYNSDFLNRSPLSESQNHEKQGSNKTAASELKKALEFYRKYKNAIPQVQEAVDALLKVPRPDP